MSEYDDYDDQREPDDAEDRRQDDIPEAGVQLARWSPWIWLIPALAIFFATYLVVRYGFFGGGDVTVTFVDARGLERYSPVRYRGAKVGTVQKIELDDELKQVVLRISIDAQMKNALRSGTRFWIVEPGLESGGIGSLLGGTHVGIAPGPGERTREFEGQAYPPILEAPEEGRTFILEADGSGGVSIGAPVDYQGMSVGRVLGAEYDPNRGVSLIHVFVVERFAGQVRQSTRFWRSGGFSLSLEGGKISMGDTSLTSLLTSGISFYTPEVLAGAAVQDRTRFELHETRSAAVAASDGPHLTYLTYFPGAVGGLSPGTSVRMRGVEVGRVRDVRLRYIPSTASLETPVTLEIDPRRLEIMPPPNGTREALRGRMNDALQNLVQKGMRATISSSLILPGAGSVALEDVARAGTGRLAIEHDPPIIPAAAGGDGLEGALASLNRVAATLEDLPLREIAGDLRSAARRVDELVQDPALDQSIARMNSALAEIEEAARTTNANIGPIAESLRNAATSAEQAAARAGELLGSTPRQNYDLAELIKELTRAAESVRALASYLTENPDALLKGRAE
ncbi:MAG: MCE family protein [Acidobacteria bacterium]|nr:MCE family protein [Acidobacteriota bacterium]